jgi:hypothetical protein
MRGIDFLLRKLALEVSLRSSCMLRHFPPDRFLQPHKVKWLETLGNLVAGYRVVAAMHITADINSGPTAYRAAVTGLTIR